MIYFKDHLNIESQDEPSVQKFHPQIGHTDNLINFPTSSNLEDMEVSKWVSILMNNPEQFSPQQSTDIKGPADRDPLDLLAEALLDKGIL